ncbi:MAG TPA: uroporphyrinogen decarboxylase family protein [Paludibaculum sp.]|jgi:uroporphyrinogen decarboxylase
MNRRHFLLTTAALSTSARAQSKLTPKDRVNLILAGKKPDRAPFTFWRDFGDAALPGLKHAAATLEFQRKYHLDIVKVMSDYPYPKGAGAPWYQLKVEATPFPEQLIALELIRDGLNGQKHFLETLFNPWKVAENLSSKEAVLQLMRDKPQALLDALEAISQSEASHARAALERGASGVFLAIANAQQGHLTRDEYRKFSEPFDRIVLAAGKDAPMNTLHLHGDKVFLDHFWKGWPAQIINYDPFGTKTSLAAARRQFSGILMGGLDHNTLATAAPASLAAVAPKWICAPGCSVPDDSSPASLLKLSRTLQAHP